MAIRPAAWILEPTRHPGAGGLLEDAVSWLVLPAGSLHPASVRRDPGERAEIVRARQAAQDHKSVRPASLVAVDSQCGSAPRRANLAVVVDCYSRRCVGWAMAEHMRAELFVEALEMAIWQRCPDAGLVHHSDRGGQ